MFLTCWRRPGLHHAYTDAASPRRRRRSRPQVQSLEDRRLLAQVLNGGALLQETFDDLSPSSIYPSLKDTGALPGSPSQVLFQHVFAEAFVGHGGTTVPSAGQTAQDFDAVGPDTITLHPYLPTGATSADITQAALDVLIESPATQVTFTGAHGSESFVVPATASGPPPLIMGSAGSTFGPPTVNGWATVAANAADVIGHDAQNNPVTLGPISRISFFLALIDNVRSIVDLGGDIKGSVWVNNGDGVRQANELGVVGDTVFVDLNRNGRLDANEPWAVTDGNGDYDIADVPAGNYPVIDTGGTISLSGTAGVNQDFGFSVSAGGGKVAVGDPVAWWSPSPGSPEMTYGNVSLFASLDGAPVTTVIRADADAVNSILTPPVPDTDFGFSTAINSDNRLIVGSPFVPDIESFNDSIASVSIFTFAGQDVTNINPYDLLGHTQGHTYPFLGVSLAVTGSNSNYWIGGSGEAIAITGDAEPSVSRSIATSGVFDSMAAGGDGDVFVGGDPDEGEVELDYPSVDGGYSSPEISAGPDGDGTSFGTSVALLGVGAGDDLSQASMFVGAPGDSQVGLEAGAVFLYDHLLVTSFHASQTFLDPAQDAGDHFGFAMAAVGSDELLIGGAGRFDDGRRRRRRLSFRRQHR